MSTPEKGPFEQIFGIVTDMHLSAVAHEMGVEAEYEDRMLAVAEERHRERDIDAELEARFLAQHEDDGDNLPEVDFPF